MLLVLWTLACFSDVSYISVVVCFAAFLVNDLYGFISWRHMQKRQRLQQLFIKDLKDRIHVTRSLIYINSTAISAAP